MKVHLAAAILLSIGFVLPGIAAEPGPENLALKAKASASAEYSEQYLARFAVDGVVPDQDARNDADHASSQPTSGVEVHRGSFGNPRRDPQTATPDSQQFRPGIPGHSVIQGQNSATSKLALRVGVALGRGRCGISSIRCRRPGVPYCLP